MDKMILLLGLTGITMIVVRAEIFSRLRDWLLLKRPQDVGYLFTCPPCMGFWIGLLGGAIYAGVFVAPLYAGAVSLLAMLVDNWFAALRRNGETVE